MQEGEAIKSIDENIIRKAVEILFKEAPGAKVILFGSHARGDAKSDSDIDFLVVIPGVVDCFVEMARLAEILGRNLIPADVVVMSEEKFNYWRDVPNTLAYRAMKEGRIYEPVV